MTFTLLHDSQTEIIESLQQENVNNLLIIVIIMLIIIFLYLHFVESLWRRDHIFPRDYQHRVWFKGLGNRRVSKVILHQGLGLRKNGCDVSIPELIVQVVPDFRITFHIYVGPKWRHHFVRVVLGQFARLCTLEVRIERDVSIRVNLKFK